MLAIDINDFKKINDHSATTWEISRLRKSPASLKKTFGKETLSAGGGETNLSSFFPMRRQRDQKAL